MIMKRITSITKRKHSQARKPRVPRVTNDDEGALVATGKPGTLVLTKLESPLLIKDFLSPSH
jgi:hypothetical protein